MSNETPNRELIEIYKIYRSYEEHENDLLNHRTGWLVTVQSVLLATFGFSFQKHLEILQKVLAVPPSAEKADMQNALFQFKIFLAALAIIGVVTCWGSYRSIKAARDAQIALRDKYNVEHKAKVDVTLKLPPIAGGGSKSAEDAGSNFAYFLPGFFAILWVIVLFGILLGVRVQFS
ncbi:MAG: hypothetical protein AB7U49_05285 [Hyphomicrobiaceae bacterium]